MKSAAQIRQEFIDFFREKQHTYVPSSPVVPHDDPTLLFTNAGMNQFKPIFLGQLTAGHPLAGLKRAANSQKCIRAGGKHNDLDDVGHDTYHHTFFEMLGNWSFGDYFKRESIEWAWELLVSRWGLDPARLHATYFGGLKKKTGDGWDLEPDAEARELWKRFLPDDHIHPGNMKDNFWEMGDTGPCGPCTEVHIDLTPDKSGAKLVNAGDARVMEIWNLVFIQFNRRPDGKLDPLPARHVDTGMGFERVTAVIQGKKSNYDTDVFSPIFEAIREVTGARAYSGALPMASAPKSAQLMTDISYRVIADHIRTLTFALADGAVPDKDGRGYVLRRILRRAVRYGWQYLNMHEPFLFKLVPTVARAFGDVFPEIRREEKAVAQVIREEEESFGRTLERGIALFNDAADTAREHNNEIRGADAFKLHDTFGFPIDLTQIMATERGLRVDVGEYERLMEEAREKARAGGKKDLAGFATLQGDLVATFGPTDDMPKYSGKTLGGATIRAIVTLDGGGNVAIRAGGGDRADSGAPAGIVLDRTCFYAEQGGQVGDVGAISAGSAKFRVEDTRRFGGVVVHFGTVAAGAFKIGDSVSMQVDQRRASTKRNHTGTHLLNWALREVLGDAVQQKGSLVDPDKLRFDFSHAKALTDDEISRIEDGVNRQIAAKYAVYSKEVDLATGMKFYGIRAVFGEKYPDRVRVVSIGAPVEELERDSANTKWRQFSIEFCGGTHTNTTDEIGTLVLTAEESVAKGVRRIVAVTGDAARQLCDDSAELVSQVESLRDTAKSGPPPANLAERVAALQSSLASTHLPLRDRPTIAAAMAELQEILKQHKKVAAAGAADLVRAKLDAAIASASKQSGATIVVVELPDAPADVLKNAADLVKSKCGSAAILFGTRGAEKATLLAAFSDDLIKRGLKAGDLVKAIAPLVGGGGGGPPTLAQAGGKNPEKLEEALKAGHDWMVTRL